MSPDGVDEGARYQMEGPAQLVPHHLEAVRNDDGGDGGSQAAARHEEVLHPASVVANGRGSVINQIDNIKHTC